MSYRSYGVPPPGGRPGLHTAPSGGRLYRYDEPIDYTGQGPVLSRPTIGSGIDPVAADRERYIRLLEGEIETLRSEMRGSREQISELTAAQRDIGRLESEYKMRIDHLERELAHMGDTAAAQSQLRTELQTLSERNRQLEHQLRSKEDELSRRDGQTTQAREQALREMEQVRRNHEQQLEHARSASNQHLAQVRQMQENHDRLVATLRSDLSEATGRAQSLQSELNTAHSENERAAELIRVLETDIKHKTDRADEQDKLVISLQTQLSEAQTALQSCQLESDGRLRRIDDLEQQTRQMEDWRREAEQREERLRRDLESKLDRQRRAYAELGEMIGATESQRQTLSVASRLREVLDEQSRLGEELMGSLRRRDELSQEGERQKLRNEQLARELDQAQETIRRQDNNLTELRDELLQRTRELRTLTADRDNYGRSMSATEDRLILLETALANKERELEDMARFGSSGRLHLSGGHHHHHLLSASGLGAAGGSSSVDHHLRLELERANESLAREQQRSRELEEKRRSDREYVEVCREIGHIVGVSPDTTTSIHAQNLLRSVRDMATELDTLRNGTAVGSNGLHYASSSQQHHQHLQHSQALAAGLGETDIWHRPQTPHFDGLGEHVDWLKAELGRAEQRMARQTRLFDTFKRDLARLLHIDSKDALKIEESVLLMKVRKLAHGGKLDGDGSSSSSGRGRHAACVTPSSSTRLALSSSGGAGSTGTGGGKNSANKAAFYKRKLQTALQTIESQDTFIELQGRRLKELESGDRGFFLRQEVKDLRAQLAGLKHGLYDETSGGAVAGESAVELRRQIEELELQIKRHIEFREKVITALGLDTVSAPDYEVMARIDQLQRDAGAAANATLRRAVSPYHLH